MRHLLLALALALPAPLLAEDITIRTLMRAESDTMFRLTMQGNGTSVGEIAHERKVDVIVMEAANPKVKDYLLGTTASHVVTHAECSVHVVRS